MLSRIVALSQSNLPSIDFGEKGKKSFMRWQRFEQTSKAENYFSLVADLAQIDEQ